MDMSVSLGSSGILEIVGDWAGTLDIELRLGGTLLNIAEFLVIEWAFSPDLSAVTALPLILTTTYSSGSQLVILLFVGLRQASTVSPTTIWESSAFILLLYSSVCLDFAVLSFSRALKCKLTISLKLRRIPGIPGIFLR